MLQLNPYLLAARLLVVMEVLFDILNDYATVVMYNYTLDIRARCDSALSQLESIRDRPRFGTEARGIIQQTIKRAANVFDVENKKRKKGMTWKHKFFCLAYVGQTRLPANEAQREELFEAGLREKEVEFDNIDISTDEFKEVLFFNYPKL